MKNNEQKQNVFTMYKKTFLYGAISGGMALFVVAIVLICLTATGAFKQKSITVNNSNQTTDSTGGNTSDKTDTEKVAYVNPLDKVTVRTEQGFYYNATLNCYYEHLGMDFSATAGSNVYAIADGTVESINSSDILRGTQIVVDHGDGVKSVYGFIEPADNVKVGAKIIQGQIIAKVADPTGAEYKEGAHLHLEMTVNSKNVDPADYFTLDEK